MRRLWVVGLLLLVLCALLVAPALAAQEGGDPSALGGDLDVFLILALPALALAQTLIIQVLKRVFPKTVVEAGTLARGIKGIFALVYIGAWIAGAQEQLVGGVSFVNELSDPILRLLGLIGLWVGPSALHAYGEKKHLPLLGESQGDVWFGWARDQTRRAA